MNERTLARVLLGILVALAVAAFLTVILSAIDGLMTQVTTELEKAISPGGLNKTIGIVNK